MGSTSPFTTYFILRNPMSTNAKPAQRRVEELRRLYPEVRIVEKETLPGGRPANAELIRLHANLLGPKTLLCVAAGDGTVNMVIESLLNDPRLPKKAALTPVLPLWGGNANDLAHMLNGPASKVHIGDVLSKGHVLPIYPLLCKLTDETTTVQVHIAACYAGFGATAFAAERLNGKAHRGSRLRNLPGARMFHEVLTVANAFLESPTFMLEEKGKVQVVYERTFTNGSRIAKINRLPIRLTDEAFYLTTLENKRFLSVAPRLLDFTRKRMAERFLHSHASFTIKEPVWAQFDGESVYIPAGTNVTVELSRRPFYTLSLLLDATRKV